MFPSLPHSKGNAVHNAFPDASRVVLDLPSHRYEREINSGIGLPMAGRSKRCWFGYAVNEYLKSNLLISSQTFEPRPRTALSPG